MNKEPTKGSMLIANYFLQEPGKILFFLSFFYLSWGNYQLFGQSDQLASFQSLKEIQFSKSEIQKLFIFNKAGKINLAFSGSGTASTFDVKILNHINRGEKTGAISGIITIGKEQARLLINRKERNGKLIYWMALLLQEGNEGFKLKSSGDTFLLERTSKDEIITE